jgi:hypothetical protein
MGDVLNARVAPDSQLSATLLAKVLGADTEIVKVVEVVPTSILCERVVAVRE